MFNKGTKIYGILKGKCPRCHEGDFFKHGLTINPSKITELHTNCSHCNLKYMLEPSFYYGAMYINYGITVALSIITFLITKLVFNVTLIQAFISIIFILIILAPINLRLSRILWIQMFVTYDKQFAAKKK
ncbi:MAG: DUF983 domain-containing protein [Polaribacter sp.]